MFKIIYLPAKYLCPIYPVLITGVHGEDLRCCEHYLSKSQPWPNMIPISFESPNPTQGNGRESGIYWLRNRHLIDLE